MPTITKWKQLINDRQLISCLTFKINQKTKNHSYYKKFEDINGVIRICKSKKDRQYNGQKEMDKLRCTKHYTEN